jgi:hypothetical protein
MAGDYGTLSIVLKCGNLSLLELSGPVQACNGIAVQLLIFTNSKFYAHISCSCIALFWK